MKTYSLEKQCEYCTKHIAKNIRHDGYNYKIRNLIDNNIERMYCVFHQKASI